MLRVKSNPQLPWCPRGQGREQESRPVARPSAAWGPPTSLPLCGHPQTQPLPSPSVRIPSSQDMPHHGLLCSVATPGLPWHPHLPPTTCPAWPRGVSSFPPAPTSYLLPALAHLAAQVSCSSGPGAPLTQPGAHPGRHSGRRPGLARSLLSTSLLSLSLTAALSVSLSLFLLLSPSVSPWLSLCFCLSLSLSLCLSLCLSPRLSL